MDEARLPIDILFDYIDVHINTDNSREYVLKKDAPKEIQEYFDKWKKGLEAYRKLNIKIE